MGKQVFQPPKNLEETERFLKNQLEEETFEAYNLSFDSKFDFYNSVRRNLEANNSNKDLITPFDKFYNKSLVITESAEAFYILAAVSIVPEVMNPSYFIQDNSPNILESDPWYGKLQTDKIKKTLPSIGRIEHFNNVEYGAKWSGTGWLLGNNGYIITNAHVADNFAKKQNGKYVFLKNDGKDIQPNIDFVEEKGSSEVSVFKIDEVCHIGDIDNGELDIAILKINDIINLPKGLSLESDDRLMKDMELASIGYPDRLDSRRSDCFAFYVQVFVSSGIRNEDNFGVKRISPGKLMSFYDNNKKIKHDCSTLDGSSGGPLINPETGKVVALHFNGNKKCLYNESISCNELRKLFSNLNIL